MATYDLVFEGGGAKGSVFVGALEVFIGAGHTAGRLVGTSAGAITAALLAAGYTPPEMLAAVTETLNGKPRFASFMDQPEDDDFDAELRENSEFADALGKVKLPGLFGSLGNKLTDELLNQLLARSPHFRQIFNFVECGGLYSGDTFVAWVKEKLGKKGISADCTLQQLNKDKGADLSLVATDTTNRDMLVLNHRTAPGLPVAMAVRMSMSIPFVWREVVWDKAWGLYMGVDKTGSKIVDGGVLSNFPIDLIATRGERAQAFMGVNTNPDAARNLGLMIDETIAVAGIPAKQVRTNPLRTVQRIQRLVDTMTGARDNALIREYAKQICRLPAQGYGTTEFDMPKEKLDALVDAGRKAMRAYLGI